MEAEHGRQEFTEAVSHESESQALPTTWYSPHWYHVVLRTQCHNSVTDLWPSFMTGLSCAQSECGFQQRRYTVFCMYILYTVHTYYSIYGI